MDYPNIPGYTELEKIGAGGFAVVYKATQKAVGRQVALKLLHNAIADEDTERRFERECRVVGSLSWHPHIAAVLDAGADANGRSYLAFELLTGGSLGDRLKETGPVPWAEAIVFAMQTADALAAAHEQDVLHRDVKPDNILIDRLGRAKLADFGIAAMRDGTQTKTGVITATLAHAAPEVLNGERATKLSDVYLLGSTLFELIAGTPPFGSGVGDDFFAAIQRIATEAPPVLRAIPGLGVPDQVSELVDRALRKNPADRFTSAAEFGMALRQVQAELSSSRTPMPYIDSTGAKGPTAPTATPADDLPSPPLPAPPLPAPPSARLPSPPSKSLPSPPLLPDPPAPSTPLSIPADRPIPARDRPISGPQPIAPVAPPAPPSPAIAGGAAPGSGEVPVIEASPEPSKKKRSPVPLVLLLLLLLGGAAAAAVVLLQPGDDTPKGIVVDEVKQTDSAPGFEGANIADGDLTTGWLSPNSPDGHELIIGFGQNVMLDAIVIHSGPNPANPGAFSGSRGVGAAILEFSDGTELSLSLDEDQAVQRVVINRRTSSLGIRSVAPGFTPVAIREVEFEGQSL